eukprot:2353102-Prymnesium_polylepis.3
MANSATPEAACSRKSQRERSSMSSSTWAAAAHPRSDGRAVPFGGWQARNAAHLLALAVVVVLLSTREGGVRLEPQHVAPVAWEQRATGGSAHQARPARASVQAACACATDAAHVCGRAASRPRPPAKRTASRSR